MTVTCKNLSFCQRSTRTTANPYLYHLALILTDVKAIIRCPAKWNARFSGSVFRRLFHVGQS